MKKNEIKTRFVEKSAVSRAAKRARRLTTKPQYGNMQPCPND
jgi:hypothetical protein